MSYVTTLSCLTQPQANERVYNAWFDLVGHLREATCYDHARANFVFKGPPPIRQATNFTKFVEYLSQYPKFYNGSRSTLASGWLLDPFFLGVAFLNPPQSGSYSGIQVRGQFRCFGCDPSTEKSTNDPNSTTTAQTVSGYYAPFTSFWYPGYFGDLTGFGVGINPANRGVNIYNESNIFHEALHGFAGTADGDLEHDVANAVPGGVGGTGSEVISIYIKNYVLNQCSIYGGK